MLRRPESVKKESTAVESKVKPSQRVKCKRATEKGREEMMAMADGREDDEKEFARGRRR